MLTEHDESTGEIFFSVFSVFFLILWWLSLALYSLFECKIRRVLLFFPVPVDRPFDRLIPSEIESRDHCDEYDIGAHERRYVFHSFLLLCIPICSLQRKASMLPTMI